MGVTGRCVRGAAAAALAVVVLCSSHADAQQWHESYRAGVAALGRGDSERAVTALRRAIALRPEPGRNVQTYGTNIEPRYFPYLRLAEAHLAQGNLDGAREALRLSAVWGAREPPAERDALVAKLEAAAAARHPAPAPPTPEPAAQAPPVTAAPAAGAPLPAVTPTPQAQAPAPVAGSRPDPSRPGERPTADLQASATPSVSGVEPARGAIEIVSQPPGASVYVDDELVGSSDPVGGRLVKTGVAPGRHRLRVAHAGHDEAVRELEVPAGGTALAAVTLAAAAAPASPFRADFVAFAVLVVLFLGGLVFLAVRKPAPPVRAIPTPMPARSVVTAPGEPHTPSHLNPGAVRDEQGLEWFGEYQVLEMLGRGGMASVFRARRRSEVAALKRPLSALLDDQDLLERFLREAAIGRTLNHPNIVRILEQGYVGRVPYFTMELLGGETLQETARRGPLPPRASASLVVQIAEALDFAHGKGVVHRDLKPSNVMVLPGEVAKVMDFGIARAKRFDGMTATAAFLGTPDYVAPEMIEGRGTEARSDMYALGVVLFELLTGRLPFTGDAPFAVLRKHCTDEPPAPSSVRAGVPEALDALVLRLLAKSPAERPTAEDLVVALREWLNRAA